MIETWLPSVEQIMLAAVDSKSRVMGVLSPDAGAGVSTLCRMVAESHARSGAKALLVDLTGEVVESADDGDGWAPSDGPQQLIQHDGRGFDVLTVRPTHRTRPLFNNVDALRSLLTEQLSAYQAIVVDLPPVLDQAERRINPLAAARACDAVVMVCLPNRLTQRRLKEAVAALGTAGVKLGGTIVNDFYDPTLGTQLADRTRSLARYAPGLASWLEARLRRSEFLNSRS